MLIFNLLWFLYNAIILILGSLKLIYLPSGSFVFFGFALGISFLMLSYWIINVFID